MKRPTFLWQAAGFAAATFAGTLLHFLFDWSGQADLIAPFSAVNESTWEHMKLLFWPLFLFAIVQRFFFRELRNFWCIKLVGMLIGLALIPILFYTYNGAFGKSPDWFNIATFYISAATAFFVEYLLFQKEPKRCFPSAVALLVMCMIGVSFVYFTFTPPLLPLFQDPLTQTYRY